MYLGSSVPHITKDGLQGIQEPLRELYPDSATLLSGNAGIDSWLSVWSNGILIENVDENGREVKRFFKIDALHYCAAVKFVSSTPSQQPLNGQNSLRFLPLDSPQARAQPIDMNPPIFASILRRTTGIKVLECHAFICKREAAANALVRCCFHAYADTMYAKQIGADVNNFANDINNNKSIRTPSETSTIKQPQMGDNQPMARRSKSFAALNESDDMAQIDAWQAREGQFNRVNGHIEQQQSMTSQSSRQKSMNEGYATNCDNNNLEIYQPNNELLRKQQKLSKSMHHINESQQQLYAAVNYKKSIMKDQMNDYDQTSASCINIPNGRWPYQDQQVPQAQPFYNPYASRVPSYPPQNLIDAANSGGTLKSIKSMAANSLASTLLRSKKNAKAMSMAQLNQDRIISFHQPHSNLATTMGGPMIMPPIPPMFLPNLPAHLMNGSQTMKVPSSRPMMPLVGPPMNFEAMTPKEMKKLLKKSAKYGIDPSEFGDNGLPILPLLPSPPQMLQSSNPQSKTGTMISQSMLSDIYNADMTDVASLHGLPPSSQRGSLMSMDPFDPNNQPVKPILVKPNPEFLKSKAGKKWIKQQKEFKKLLPPHLEGLPIIFGPPPIDALEPATLPNHNIPPPPPNFIPSMASQPGLPVMDSSGYYNPHPFYGQNGRASAASTLLRYSPQGKMLYENSNGINTEVDYSNRGNIMYGNGMMVHQPQTSMIHRQRDYISDNSSMVYGNNECGPDSHQRPYHIDNFKQSRLGRGDHMIEQSIISLGDENDYDDEEIEEGHTEYYRENKNHDQESESQSKIAKMSAGNSRVSGHITNNDGNYNRAQQIYDRNSIQHSNVTDDQSSLSSGIYKRGHINERAFSYSIRQEHKNGVSNSEYVNKNGSTAENDDFNLNHENQQHSNIYQNKSGNYYSNNNQSVPVNELTARLENQLSMKSFANSKSKSHM